MNNNFGHWLYIDRDTNTLYIEIRKCVLSQVIRDDIPNVNRIFIQPKDHYEVEFVDEIENSVYRFKVLAYYRSWFKRNMK